MSTKSVILLFLLVFCAVGAHAQGSFTALTCNQTDVNAVINGPTHTAVNGDVINIPAGTCPWTTNGITIPAGVNISIIGAGQASTTINDSIPTNATQCTMFAATPSTVGSLTRFSGMTVQPGVGVSAICAFLTVQGACNASGCTNLRVDHITFPSTWVSQASCCMFNSFGLTAIGSVFGVFDHNTVSGIATSYLHLTEFNLGSYQGIGGFGDNSWAKGSGFGTPNSIFVENNTFNSAGAGDSEQSAGAFSDEGGARIVVRYNTYNSMALTPAINLHGTDSNGRPRGPRTIEFYNNTYTCASGQNCVAVGINSGAFLVYNNTVTILSQLAELVSINIRRASTQFGVSGTNGFGPCDGTDPHDTNDGITYASGTHTGANGATTLTDSGQNWTVNQWAGSALTNGTPYSLHNTNATRLGGSEITSNTNNTVSYIQDDPGKVLTFNTGDGYQIMRATVCIDQPTRGAGRLYTDSSNVAVPLLPANQALVPAYEWADTYSGGTPTFGSLASATARLIQNRDFYQENINQAAQSNVSTPFDGTTTIGMGHGTIANRPATCTPGLGGARGVGYFATNVGPQGTLFICTGAGGSAATFIPNPTYTASPTFASSVAFPETVSYSGDPWVTLYAPYTYPHPLNN